MIVKIDARRALWPSLAKRLIGLYTAPPRIVIG